MSADNGIYIGVFSKGGKKEYRVIHAQAIENCLSGEIPDHIVECFRVLYFFSPGTPVFDNEKDAVFHGYNLLKKITNQDGFAPEYGLSTLEFSTCPMRTFDEAKKEIRDYFDQRYMDGEDLNNEST